MSDKSAIEWTDATWNPTTGCTKISPGCAHCYIERTPAFRIAGNRFDRGKTDLTIFHDRLAQPLHWRKPRRVFVNSLSDLFHEDISDAFIDQVFAVMALTPRHTFQVLTKRAERMRQYIRNVRPERLEEAAHGLPVLTWNDLRNYRWPLSNVWLGVSVENQHFADERIAELVNTPSAVRFLSLEPLLEHVDLMAESHFFHHFIHWVIVGGESGPRARPFDLAWARSILRQCKPFGIPVFVKQLGANARQLMIRPGCSVREAFEPLDLHDRKGGNIDEWPSDLRIREFPAVVTQPQPAPAVREDVAAPVVPLREKDSSS